MCGTVAVIGVQLVPQGRSMILLGISNVVAGFCASADELELRQKRNNAKAGTKTADPLHKRR
jgi:hypothetical protein